MQSLADLRRFGRATPLVLATAVTLATMAGGCAFPVVHPDTGTRPATVTEFSIDDHPLDPGDVDCLKVTDSEFIIENAASKNQEDTDVLFFSVNDGQVDAVRVEYDDYDGSDIEDFTITPDGTTALADGFTAVGSVTNDNSYDDTTMTMTIAGKCG